MKRYLTVWPLAGLAFQAAVLATPLDAVPANQDKPNIVLVMADDQGWGDMAYNGHPVLQTPHFDEASAAGLRFDRFYAAAPVCTPTRASVLTGRHPNRMGAFSWGLPLRPQETTIAEVLQGAGYTCGHFGKWHLGSVRRLSPVHPGKQGFDRWFSAPNFFDNDPIMSDEGTAQPMVGESSAITVDAAIGWIERQAQRQQPFLAVVWFGSPHKPHRASEQDKSLYRNYSAAEQDFYGEITGMDRAFGKLREALSKQGIRDNTLLWYCSDNGGLPGLGATGGRGAKGSIYDGGLLVPAFMEWPARISQPHITRMRCNTCDILPTVMEITGHSLPDSRPVDGISLVALIERRSETNQRSRPMGFWSFPKGGRGVSSERLMSALLAAQSAGEELAPDEESLQASELPGVKYRPDEAAGHAAWLSGDWKLHRINKKQQAEVWELYDLHVDPLETRNLVESEPERAAIMNQELAAWQESVVRSLNGEDYGQ